MGNRQEFISGAVVSERANYTVRAVLEVSLRIDQPAADARTSERVLHGLIERAAAAGEFTRALSPGDLCAYRLRSAPEGETYEERVTTALVRLWGDISDMVIKGRLTEADIPDDHAALVRRLAECTRAAAGQPVPLEEFEPPQKAFSQRYRGTLRRGEGANTRERVEEVSAGSLMQAGELLLAVASAHGEELCSIERAEV